MEESAEDAMRWKLFMRRSALCVSCLVLSFGCQKAPLEEDPMDLERMALEESDCSLIADQEEQQEILIIESAKNF